MGGTPSKSRGRGDAPDIFERSSNSDTALRSHRRRVCKGDYANDRKLHARWEQLVEGSASTPSFRNQTLSNTEKGGVACVIPSSRGDEAPAATVIATRSTADESLPNLLPPKIQLQILSPVHSRQQLRDQSKFQKKPFIGLRVPTTSSIASIRTSHSERSETEKTTPEEGEPKLLFLKQPAKEFHQDGKNSEQEIQTPRGTRTYLQQQEQIQQRIQQQKEEQAQAQQKHKNKVKRETNFKKKRLEGNPSSVPPPTVTISSSTPAPFSPATRGGESSSCYTSQGFDTRPGTRTINRSPPKYGTVLNHRQHDTGSPDVSLGKEDEKSLCPPREQTAVSTASSSRKLKVKGLKNFVDTHKPCPPLWAKQFPCRSRFHPDNYLYDFEGFNAPKRPVAAMDKCSKKCGRCNRCGIYVDNICMKCSMCKMDCKCPKAADPSLPSPEHFLSQLFGPGWSQSTRMEVNGVPVVPDKPRLNLHAASSGNPLKVKDGEGKEDEGKANVLPAGYDTYTKVPDTANVPPQAAYPAYSSPYPYTYPAPGYPPWPGYYPTYVAPLPPPVPMPPYYGYAVPPHPAAPPVGPTPYSYPAR